MKKPIILISILTLYCLTTLGQTFHINSCNGSIEIDGNLLKAASVENKDYAINSVIKATEKDVTINFSYQDQAGHITLPYGRQITISRIKNSQYTTLDPADSYFAFIFDMIRYFKNKEEKNEDYQKRMAEVLGMSRGSTITPLQSPINRRILKSYDLDKIKSINDSLARQSVTDSVVIYLKDGIFLEQQAYFGFALDHYQKAFLYLQKNRKNSKVVSTIYQQALYRMGKVKEGDDIEKFIK